MVRPVVKLNNRSIEMEIKALKLSSDMKDNLRAPIVWEKPSNSTYEYNYDCQGLYYQVTTQTRPIGLDTIETSVDFKV